MEKITDQIKKQIINSTPRTRFIKLNNIVSIFIFIFFFSSFVSLSSYTRHFTSSSDRHYIFLLCNGILIFLIMNFDSTHTSSKNNQPVNTHETNHQPVLIVSSSAMEPVATMEEQKEEIEGQDDEIKQKGNWVCVIQDHSAVSIIEDQIEDKKAEIRSVVNDEQETRESKEAAETEEFNKRCEEFICKMKERMKVESSVGGRLQLTRINATISF